MTGITESSGIGIGPWVVVEREGGRVRVVSTATEDAEVARRMLDAHHAVAHPQLGDAKPELLDIGQAVNALESLGDMEGALAEQVREIIELRDRALTLAAANYALKKRVRAADRACGRKHSLWQAAVEGARQWREKYRDLRNAVREREKGAAS